MMNTSKAGKFSRGSNAGTAKCAECGKTRQRANMANEMCCVDCYEIAGLENEHLDGGHEDSIVVDCPMCKADAEELNIELPAPADKEAGRADEIKAEIKELDAAWRAAEAAGDESRMNELTSTYNALVEELESVVAESGRHPLDCSCALHEADPAAVVAGLDAQTITTIALNEKGRFTEPMVAAATAEIDRRFDELEEHNRKAAPALTPEMAAAYERLNREVTEEYCFLCSRATDHRGEHEIEELEASRA